MAELETDGKLTRSQVAAFLREFADEIDDRTIPGRDDWQERGADLDEREGRREEFDEREGTPEELTSDREERRAEFAEEGTFEPKRVTLIVGGDSATVTVPETVEFDVEVESRSPMLGSGVHQGIDLALSWEIENPDDLDEDWIEVE